MNCSTFAIFSSKASIGLCFSATYYVFTGEIFPGESMQSLITILEAGAVIPVIGALYPYLKKLRELPEEVMKTEYTAKQEYSQPKMESAQKGLE